MLIIGSQAAKHWGILRDNREPSDTDVICTFDEFQKEAARIKREIGIVRCVPLSDKTFHIRDKNGWNYEFEIAWPGSSGEQLMEIEARRMICLAGKYYASPATQLALKLSHRYLKDSPHFLKTLRDIQYLRSLGCELDAELQEWLPKREAETYVYKHPKLNVTSKEFFNGDGVNYLYDHDSIHEAVAIRNDYSWPEDSLNVVAKPRPAYKDYMKDGSEVMTSKDKFLSADEHIRLLGVYEESCVLALERSQIPHGLGKEDGPTARWSFEMALMKVCTSITSGWFREYAWENYDKVLDLYNELGDDDYIKRFERNQHLLKPYKGE